jgi:hypothetical protein
MNIKESGWQSGIGLAGVLLVLFSFHLYGEDTQQSPLAEIANKIQTNNESSEILSKAFDDLQLPLSVTTVFIEDQHPEIVSQDQTNGNVTIAYKINAGVDKDLWNKKIIQEFRQKIQPLSSKREFAKFDRNIQPPEKNKLFLWLDVNSEENDQPKWEVYALDGKTLYSASEKIVGKFNHEMCTLYFSFFNVDNRMIYSTQANLWLKKLKVIKESGGSSGFLFASSSILLSYRPWLLSDGYGRNDVDVTRTIETAKVTLPVKLLTQISSVKVSFFSPDEETAAGTDKNAAESQFALFKSYAQKNRTIAIEWLTKSAANGYAAAQNQLGCFYLDGVWGFQKNAKTAEEWLSKASEQKDARAQYNLYLLYHNGGDGVAKDEVKALALLTQAAENGSKNAPNALAQAYYDGSMGLKRDVKMAEKWWLKGAELKDDYAQYNLYLLYHNGGDGVAKDEEKASQWLNVAADNGNKNAKNNLIALGKISVNIVAGAYICPQAPGYPFVLNPDGTYVMPSYQYQPVGNWRINSDKVELFSLQGRKSPKEITITKDGLLVDDVLWNKK